jgi:hypothetical protein
MIGCSYWRNSQVPALVRLLGVTALIICLAGTAQAQHDIWNRHVIDASFSGADGVRLQDVNKDGLSDIATGWEESGYTLVYLHPGYELVHEKWPSVIVGKTPSVEDAVFADLDGDGSFEVISCTEGDNKRIYISKPPKGESDFLDSSKWTNVILDASDGLMQWMFAAPVQLDGINGLDFVAGAKGENAQVGWFQAPINANNISDWSWHPVSSATWIMSIFIKDMDDDGDLDIVVSDRKPGGTNGVRWLENPGPGEKQFGPWKNHFIGAQNVEVMFMDMADLDGDGLEDVIATEYTNQKIIFMRKLDHSGLNWKSYFNDIPVAAGRAKAVKAGDIDGDGKLDIVLSTNTLKKKNKEGIVWLSYGQSPTEPNWKFHSLSGPEGYKFDRMELIDIDGDGDLDVLTCEENYGENSEGLGVIWYENPTNHPVKK